MGGPPPAVKRQGGNLKLFWTIFAKLQQDWPSNCGTNQFWLRKRYCLYVSPYVCMFLCLSVYLSVCMSFCLSVCPRSLTAQLSTSRWTCSGCETCLEVFFWKSSAYKSKHTLIPILSHFTWQKSHPPTPKFTSSTELKSTFLVNPGKSMYCIQCDRHSVSAE